MSYGRYPFWEKNRADRESARAFEASREASKSREELDAIKIEIAKYQSLGSKNMTKEQLDEILDKISKILSK
ncbi:MAG TPA: hypothetical protein VGR54_02810 [Nitrosopumilaceae archaeon]|nr:hypothetical protein [Nitrosopumilaceae archaeon]